MKTIYKLFCVMFGIFLLMPGCSTTQIKHHSRGMEPPFCKNGLQGAKVAVYWDTAWRKDQKEVECREKILAEGISSFFGRSQCISVVKISRSVGSRPVAICSEVEIASDALLYDADKAIVLRVEEFGPNLILYLSPILWETKNEVLLRTKILDSRKAVLEADVASHWYRGGSFMLLGTRNLPRDFEGIFNELFGDGK